jgi:hypothetical protein
MLSTRDAAVSLQNSGGRSDHRLFTEHTVPPSAFQAAVLRASKLTGQVPTFAGLYFLSFIAADNNEFSGMASLPTG